ncbi:hypothetical protein FH972_009587 [Carpinus fangiana]|uniref:Uncharacterized protein n=1 Tax=Carpinus fangiana TaxID=176857 RepID=A0A660KSN4_9ROSI|nr:hypothetical protein FH972_009587 [Carpinus fangiana]
MTPPVIVRKVWQHNLDEELMKLNVESTKLALRDVNSNLTICDASGEKSCCCWEFNFKGFDQHIEFYNKESIALLNRQGIDFHKNRDMGIDPFVFQELMLNCDLLYNSRISWFTFDTAYDFGYFISTNSCFLKDDKNFRPGRDWAYVYRRSKSYGSWKVVAQISSEAYCLDTAPIHKVFHVSVLSKWLGARAPTLFTGVPPVDPLRVLSISDTSKGNKKEVSSNY